MSNIVLFSGGFDPLHSGHIEAIKEARTRGRVVLAVNSDDWLKRKKGKRFLPLVERKAILSQLKDILCVIDFDDSDDTAIDAIKKVRGMFSKEDIIFINGGDRNRGNTPEMQAFAHDPSIIFQFGVGGGNKLNSSSSILKEWKHDIDVRSWGTGLTYHESRNAKVKRLVLKPGAAISMQWHKNRSEFWFVEEGEGRLTTLDPHGTEVELKTLSKHEYTHVSVYTWHKLYNTGTEDLEIIEIQYGSECNESDIIRK